MYRIGNKHTIPPLRRNYLVNNTIEIKWAPSKIPGAHFFIVKYSKLVLPF